MGVPRRDRRRRQLSLYDEAQLVTSVSERQARLVSQVLGEAARSTHVSEENTRLERELSGSMDRLQEVHHRVRNHLQAVTGLLSAQGMGETSPTARRALQKSAGRLASIAAIHDLLARDPSSGRLRLPELTQQLTQHLLRHTDAENRIQVRTDISPVDMDTRQATAFVLILTELLSNSLEHAFGSDEWGTISVRLRQERGRAELEVHDSGRGLPSAFDVEQADSLGLKLAGRLATRDLGGSLTATNEGGACFRLTFPIQISEGDS